MTGYKIAVLAIVAFTLAAGAYLRVSGNGQKLFWYDEVFTGLWYSGHDLDAARTHWAGRRMRPADLRSLQQLDENSHYSSVITNIIHDDPQHSPLYFLLLRGWSQWAGDSIGRLRDFSALSGVLILPLLFWLCIELTASRRTAWVAVLLVTVSPFHIVYAQEARQYTLWMLFIVLASAILLSTLRSPHIWKWAAYALTVAAGLYTHLLFCFIPAAHMVYVAGTKFVSIRSKAQRGISEVIASTARQSHIQAKRSPQSPRLPRDDNRVIASAARQSQIQAKGLPRRGRDAPLAPRNDGYRVSGPIKKFLEQCKRHNGQLLQFTIAAAAGTLLFAPWAWIIYSHLQTAVNHVSWTQKQVSLLRLVGMWGYNYSSLFLDTNHRLATVTNFGWLDYSALLIQALLLLPGVCAVVGLMRRPRSRASLFLLPLLLIPFVSLALPDLLFGGIRSGGGNRYLAPSMLALEIALAGWISAGLGPLKHGLRTNASSAFGFLLATFVAAGLLSGVLFNRADTAWHKTFGGQDIKLAREINAADHPLVVADSFVRLLTLGHHVGDDTTLMYTAQTPSAPPAWTSGPVFLLYGANKGTVYLIRSGCSSLFDFLTN